MKLTILKLPICNVTDEWGLTIFSCSFHSSDYFPVNRIALMIKILMILGDIEKFVN